MKITAFALLRTLPFMLMMFTCAKESEEDAYTDEDQDYIEIQYGKNDAVTKSMAIENWETFLKHAQTSFALTESNLNSLQLRMEESDEEERPELRALHTSSKVRLAEVKKQLKARNAAFERELEKYDKQVQPRNEAFKKQFKREIFDINIEMEKVFEE